MASVGSIEVWKTVNAVLDTGAGPKLVKTDCLLLAWAGNVVTMNATPLRSAANTQLETKKVVWLHCLLGQRIAEMGFLIETYLGIDMILGTVCIDENIEVIDIKKDTLKHTSPSADATEKNIGNAACTANNVKTQEGNPREDYNEYQCIVFLQRVMLPMNEVHLHKRNNSRGVQLVTLHKNPVKIREVHGAQRIVEVMPAKPFIIKLHNWTLLRLLIPKEMKLEICLEALKKRMKSQDLVEDSQSKAVEDRVDDAQINMTPEPKKQLFEKHRQVKQKEGDIADKRLDKNNAV